VPARDLDHSPFGTDFSVSRWPDQCTYTTSTCAPAKPRERRTALEAVRTVPRWIVHRDCDHTRPHGRRVAMQHNPAAGIASGRAPIAVDYPRLSVVKDVVEMRKFFRDGFGVQVSGGLCTFRTSEASPSAIENEESVASIRSLAAIDRTERQMPFGRFPVLPRARERKRQSHRALAARLFV